MAIPLRDIDSRLHRKSSSLDSETSAILAYALGKHVDTNDDGDDLSDLDSNFTRGENEDEEQFFKENDPLNSEYDVAPQKKVAVCPKSRRLSCLKCALLWEKGTDVRNHGGFGCIFIPRWG